jgi:hypothetical protein
MKPARKPLSKQTKRMKDAAKVKLFIHELEQMKSTVSSASADMARRLDTVIAFPSILTSH